MKKSIIYIFTLLICQYLTAQSFIDEIGLKLTGKIGLNSVLMPSRNNIIEFIDGVKKRNDFETKTSFTLGICASGEIWPIYSKYFGYGYTRDFSEGWLFTESHSMQNQGHLFYLGIEKFKVISELSIFSRRCAGYSFNQSYSQSYVEELNRSLYENVKRTMLGIQFEFTYFKFKIGYIIEKYEFNDIKSNGFIFTFTKHNNFEIKAECIYNHPIKGVIANGIIVPTDLPQNNYYIYLSFSKCFDIKKSYKKIFSK